MVRLSVFTAALLFAVASPEVAVSSERQSAPSADDLLRLIELGSTRGGLALSSDGAQFAIVERSVDFGANDYRHRVIVIPTAPGARPVEVGDAGGFLLHNADGRRSGGPLDGTPAWSPNSRWIAYIAERDGRAELWRSSSDGRRRSRAAATEGDVRAFRWLDNRRIVVETGPPRSDLAAERRNARERGFRVDDRFEPVYALEPFGDDTPAFFVVDVRQGRASPAGPDEIAALRARPAQRAWIAPAPDAPPVAQPPFSVYAATPDGGTLVCEADACMGRLFGAVALDNGDVAFIRAEGFAGALSGLYIWSPGKGAVRELRVAEERLASCSEAQARLYCLQETPTEPRRLVSIDLESGDARVEYEPNPGWAAFALPDIERIDVVDERGLPSYAHLVYPVDYTPGEAYPAVIVQYRSRGFLRAGVGGENPIFPLAAKGYFVLSVERPEDRIGARERDARSLEREQELTGEERRMKLASLDLLIDDVASRGLVDADRIAITGMSDGSETLFWAIRERRYAAAVASTPPSDASAWWLLSRTFRENLHKRIGATAPWSDADPQWARWWKVNNTSDHAGEIDTPVLFNLSASEALTAFPLAVRLAELSIPTEIYIYPDAYHLKWRPLHLLSAQHRGMAWIDFWLKGAASPDETDPDRDVRWEAMRAAYQSRDR